MAKVDDERERMTRRIVKTGGEGVYIPERDGAAISALHSQVLTSPSGLRQKVRKYSFSLGMLRGGAGIEWKVTRKCFHHKTKRGDIPLKLQNIPPPVSCPLLTVTFGQNRFL